MNGLNEGKLLNAFMIPKLALTAAGLRGVSDEIIKEMFDGSDWIGIWNFKGIFKVGGQSNIL